MNQSKVKFWNSVVSRFALLFTGLNIMAILIVGYLVYQQAASVITAHSQERMQYTADLAVKSFNSLLTEVANDIALTTNNPILARYFNDPSDNSDDDLKAFFATILQNKPHYFQIRLLDVTSGMEMIRFDKVESRVVQIADEQLQFKGDRDYFKEAIKIPEGSYYYSDINLNEEFGKVSTPLIPTIRAVGQVIDITTSLRALLVINVDLSAFYEELNQIMGPGFHLMLVNGQDDYLFARDMEICFGKQLGSGRSFQNDFNQSIAAITSGQNIGFIQDLSDNRFLFHLETISYSPGQQIYLINLQQDNLLFQSAHVVRDDSFKLVVLICLISSIVSLLFARAFSKNINQITQAVSSYEEDDTQNRRLALPETRKDELGVLARAFIRMRHRIDQQLGALKAALNSEQQAIKDRDQFLQNMSHELRTPLNAILGLSRLLYKNNPSNDQLPIIESLEKSAKNLSGLVHDVLDHQKLIEGAVKLNLQPANIHSLLADIHAGYRYEAVSKGLKFELDLQESLRQANYLIDALRFNQVITNLVVNAIKFTESGSIQLAARMDKDRSNTLKVSVTDSGIGIHPKNLQKIKDRFYQESNRNSASEAGYGLGLSIVKQLVDLFGGTLEVASEQGHGSQFVVFLPLIPVEVSEYQPTGDENRWPRLHGSYSILHIEDDPSTLLLVAHLLETTPATLVQSSNFEEAASLLEKGHFDLIISDLMLNKSTLDSELTKIRDTTSIPLILVSASEPARMEAISAYYLQKPIEASDLKNLVVIMLGQQEYDIPRLQTIYAQYDQEPDKISNFLSILHREFDSYIERFETVLKSRDETEWQAILHKLNTHIKSLQLDKLASLIPETAAKLDEESFQAIIDELLYCLCVFRHEQSA